MEDSAKSSVTEKRTYAPAGFGTEILVAGRIHAGAAARGVGARGVRLDAAGTDGIQSVARQRLFGQGQGQEEEGGDGGELHRESVD